MNSHVDCLRIVDTFRGAFLVFRWAQTRTAEPEGLTWETAELVLGDVAVGRTHAVEVGWHVAGTRAVELVSVLSSCGCAQVRLLHGEREIESGTLPGGSRGVARFKIKERNAPGRRVNHIDLVWRRGEDSSPLRSRLGLDTTFVASWQVDPPALLHADLAPGTTVPVAVTWRGLTSARVQSLSIETTLPFRVRSLRAEASADGRQTVQLAGVLDIPRGVPGTLSGVLRVEGVEPVLPEVPMHCTVRPLVTRSPAGLVRLEPGTTGAAVGSVRLAFAKELGGVHIDSTRVEPQSEQSRVQATVLSTPEGAELRLSGRFDEKTSHASGSLVAVTSAPDLGEIQIRWMYLKPRGHPQADSAGQK